MAPVVTTDEPEEQKIDLKAASATSGSKEDEEAVSATSTDEEDEGSYSLFDVEDLVPQRYGISSTRVFDIFKVQSHTKATKCGSDGKTCAISGSIQVIDQEVDTRYDIYSRKQSDPDIIQSDGTLLIAGFPVIQCAEQLKVLVNLYCSAHNAMIAEGSFDLDYTGPYEFDKVITQDVCGEDGWVSVSHMTFQHANIAVIEWIIVESNCVDDIDLFGRITMCFEEALGNDFDKYSRIVLFDNSLSGSAPVKYNQDIKLSRSCLVGPGFHSLKIELKFKDRSGESTIAKDMILKVDSTGTYEERVDENSIIKLRVSWPNFYERPREKKFQQQLSAKQIFLMNIDSMDFNTKEEARGPSTRALLPFDKFSLVEVFSVVPCTRVDSLDIHGTVQLIDSSDNVCSIFEGPEKCSRSKALTITCYPSSCDCTYDGFRIEVDLSNERGCTVGKGVVHWGDSHLKSFLDRHLCEIFEGDIGYVAVHYAMIRKGLMARITTSVARVGVGGLKGSVSVFGNIKAGYSGYKYATSYDKDFYRSTLFSRDSDESVEVEVGSELPLSKSVMAVPGTDSLVLDVKLKVKVVGDKEFETIEQEVSFQPFACGIYAIDTDNYALSVCVQWTTNGADVSSIRPIIPSKRSLQQTIQSLTV